MATTATPPKVYRSQVQRGLEIAWRQGRHGFATAISNLEKKFSPTPYNSRITWDTSYPTSAFLLLCQVPDDMMLRIFNNTLIEDVCKNNIQLKPWNIITPLRNPDPKNRPSRKAGIYILYLAKQNGEGLKVGDYQRFVDVMMAVIDNRPHNGRDFVSECDQFIKTQSNDKVSDISEIQRSCRKHRNDFARFQKTLISEAKNQNATEIRLQGEVGWSEDMDVRYGQHHDLIGSANFFRLARCVLSQMFPGEFYLHGICLFRALQTKDAEFGEAMGSHIATSYAMYGGWNYVQGGMHTNTANNTGITSRYKDSANQNPGLVKMIKDLIEVELQTWERKCQQQKDKLKIVENHIQKEQIMREIEELLTTKINILDFRDRLASSTRHIERLDRMARQKDEEYDRCFNFLEDLARDIGQSLPTYNEADTTEELWGLTQKPSQNH